MEEAVMLSDTQHRPHSFFPCPPVMGPPGRGHNRLSGMFIANITVYFHANACRFETNEAGAEVGRTD